MNRFSMIVFAFGLPLMGFLALNDGVSTLYKNLGPQPGELAYVVAEVEEAEPEPEPVSEPAVEAVADDEVAEVEAEPVAEEAEVAEPEVASVEPAAIDLAAAGRLMRRCTACHQIEQERNGVGPHLLGVVGREIGSVEGYRYSDALVALNADGQVWTEDALVDWLENPAGFAAGTKMNFKVRSEEDRRLIAAWLAQNEG